jgi:hypothetical protein
MENPFGKSPTCVEKSKKEKKKTQLDLFVGDVLFHFYLLP